MKKLPWVSIKDKTPHLTLLASCSELWDKIQCKPPPLTPFEKAGYTDETKFRVLIPAGGLEKGDIVKIARGDRSKSPLFTTEDGRMSYMWLPGDAEDEYLEVYKGDEK